MERFLRTALCCAAVQGYGLSETCGAVSVAAPDRAAMAHCIGIIQTCAEFRLQSVPEMGWVGVGVSWVR